MLKVMLLGVLAWVLVIGSIWWFGPPALILWLFLAIWCGVTEWGCTMDSLNEVVDQR